MSKSVVTLGLVKHCKFALDRLWHLSPQRYSNNWTGSSPEVLSNLDYSVIPTHLFRCFENVNIGNIWKHLKSITWCTHNAFAFSLHHVHLFHVLEGDAKLGD